MPITKEQAIKAKEAGQMVVLQNQLPRKIGNVYSEFVSLITHDGTDWDAIPFSYLTLYEQPASEPAQQPTSKRELKEAELSDISKRVWWMSPEDMSYTNRMECKHQEKMLQDYAASLPSPIADMIEQIRVLREALELAIKYFPEKSKIVQTLTAALESKQREEQKP